MPVLAGTGQQPGRDQPRDLARRITGSLCAWLGFTLPSALAIILFGYGVTELGDLSQAAWLHGLLHDTIVWRGNARRVLAGTYLAADDSAAELPRAA